MFTGFDAAEATLTDGPGGDEPRPCNRGNGCYPQLVANLGTTSGTFDDLAVSAALDGAVGRRPGDASRGQLASRP